MLEKNAKDFAEEMEALAEKFSERFEGRGHEDWGFRVFGLVGPLIGSVFGTLFLLVFAWFVSLVNAWLGIGLFYSVSSFVRSNIHWFFGLFIFFGYSDYFSRRYRKSYWTVSPFVNGVTVFFVVWMAVFALNAINRHAGSLLIAGLSNFLYSNIFTIMFAFMALGYILILIEKIIIKGLK